MIPLVAFLLTFCTLVVLLRSNLANYALDAPNSRSLHTKAIPRTGGLALVLGVLVSLFLLGGMWVWIALLSALMSVSLADDFVNLPVHLRFTIQLAVSALFVYFLTPQSVWWLAFLAVIALVWMTNLYNFMDGSDGLAGGMAVFGFGTYAVAAYLAGHTQIAMLNGAIMFSSVAFLFFNFHPAKIFMGDSGSIPLGFLAGAVGIYGAQANLWPLWFPLLVFSPFIVDATVTLIKRAIRHEKVWQAHREHYYQRLVQLGWGHKKTAIVEYVLMLSVSVSALFALKLTNVGVAFILLFWGFVYPLLMFLVDKKWKHRQPQTSYK